jgi:hypothetical protein
MYLWWRASWIKNLPFYGTNAPEEKGSRFNGGVYMATKREWENHALSKNEGDGGKRKNGTRSNEP